MLEGKEMPTGRIVLKSICQSKKLAQLNTDGARLLYTWLIVNVDINGCFSGDPTVIKGQIFTRLKHSLKTIESYLQDLKDKKLIICYQSDSDLFLMLPDFKEKQPSLQPDREAKPTIPLPTPEELQRNSRGTPDFPITSKVKESKGKESKGKYKDFVFLTKEEYKKLIEKIGKASAEDYIDRLNDYIGSKGKQYKSHYHTILVWVKKDKGAKSKSEWDKTREELEARKPKL